MLRPAAGFSLFAVMTLVPLVASSAPLLPKTVTVTDEIRSLAGLRNVQLKVDHIPGAMRDVGVDEASVMELISKLLEEAGIRIVDTDAPTVVFKAIVIDDKAHDLVSFTLFLDVQQRVHLHRLEQDLSLATFTAVCSAMTKRTQLGRLARRQMIHAANQLLSHLDEANNARR